MTVRLKGKKLESDFFKRKTADFFDYVLTRIASIGALYLGCLAIIPNTVIAVLKVPFYLGGTSLLILVGVVLDTLQQIESHLLMRHYDGLMKSGRIKGRTTASAAV